MFCVGRHKIFKVTNLIRLEVYAENSFPSFLQLDSSYIYLSTKVEKIDICIFFKGLVTPIYNIKTSLFMGDLRGFEHQINKKRPMAKEGAFAILHCSKGPSLYYVWVF